MQTIVINGIPLQFDGDPEDYYFQHLSEFHSGSPHLGWFARHHLARDAVCVDVGANIGLTALTLAAHCPEGHVYAFEASPKNVKYLRRNIAASALQNVTIIDQAVGREAGEIAFYMSVVGANSVVVRPGATYDEARVASVRMTALDDWFSRSAPHRVDFIKIDVEGYEEHVLAGAAELIASQRPQIFMEFNSVTIAFEARMSPLTFGEAIWSAFEVFAITESGELSPAGGGDLHRFVLDNMVKHACVEDVLLRLRPGLDAATLASFLSGRHS